MDIGPSPKTDVLVLTPFTCSLAGHFVLVVIVACSKHIDQENVSIWN